MHKADRLRIDARKMAVWLGAASCLGLVVLAIVPLETIQAAPVFCPFRRFFGIECFGCGLTRALSAILHGQVRLALSYNRGVLVALPVLAGAVFASLVQVRAHMREVRLGLALSWVVASVVTSATVIAPSVFSTQQLDRMTPRCERKALYGRECAFCGMTSGFIDIAHGRFDAARRSNRGAIPLYAGFVGNGLALPIALWRARRRKTC